MIRALSRQILSRMLGEQFTDVMEVYGSGFGHSFGMKRVVATQIILTHVFGSRVNLTLTSVNYA